MSRGFVVAFLAVLVSMAIVSVAPPNPGPTDGVVGGGDAVMSTDKACYAPGEDVTITATGLAWVPAIGSFPVVFWGITNASGEAVFQPVNALAAIGELDGTLEGTWNQTYLLDTYEHGPDPRTGTPVPPGMYTIWFYEVLPEEWRPPGWVPTDIKIGDCDGDSTATLRVTPRTLDLRSHGQWVTAWLAFSEPVADAVDPASLLLNGIPAARAWVENETTLMAKFHRDELAGVLSTGPSVPLRVSGTLADGRAFEAFDLIRVIDPGR